MRLCESCRQPQQHLMAQFPTRGASFESLRHVAHSFVAACPIPSSLSMPTSGAPEDAWFGKILLGCEGGSRVRAWRMGEECQCPFISGFTSVYAFMQLRGSSPGGGFLMLRCIYESLCPEKTTKWPSRVKSRHQMLPAGLTQAYERPMISIEFVPHLRGRVCE